MAFQGGRMGDIHDENSGKQDENSPRFSTSQGSVIVSPMTARTDCDRDVNLGCTIGGLSMKSGSSSGSDRLFPNEVPAKRYEKNGEEVSYGGSETGSNTKLGKNCISAYNRSHGKRFSTGFPLPCMLSSG
uniref:Uncharacterized protein n=1 Tax=Anopheles maculatus TaxID=74869 RepID=A0A182SIJ5_9DIPT